MKLAVLLVLLFASVSSASLVALKTYANTNCTGSPAGGLALYYYVGICANYGGATEMVTVNGNTATVATYANSACTGTPQTSVQFTCGTCTLGFQYSCSASYTSGIETTVYYTATGCPTGSEAIAIQAGVTTATCQSQSNAGCVSATGGSYQVLCSPPGTSAAASVVVGMATLFVAAVAALLV